MKIPAKFKTSQTKTAGTIKRVVEGGPFSGEVLYLSPYGKTLEFTARGMTGQYVTSYNSTKWEPK